MDGRDDDDDDDVLFCSLCQKKFFLFFLALLRGERVFWSQKNISEQFPR